MNHCLVAVASRRPTSAFHHKTLQRLFETSDFFVAGCVHGGKHTATGLGSVCPSVPHVVIPINFAIARTPKLLLVGESRRIGGSTRPTYVSTRLSEGRHSYLVQRAVLLSLCEGLGEGHR